MTEECSVAEYTASPEEEIDEEHVDLEECSVDEIDRRIAAMKEKIDKIPL